MVAWIESNDNGESIIKARNSANSGNSFSNENIGVVLTDQHLPLSRLQTMEVLIFTSHG